MTQSESSRSPEKTIEMSMLNQAIEAFQRSQLMTLKFTPPEDFANSDTDSIIMPGSLSASQGGYTTQTPVELEFRPTSESRGNLKIKGLPESVMPIGLYKFAFCRYEFAKETRRLSLGKVNPSVNFDIPEFANPGLVLSGSSSQDHDAEALESDTDLPAVHWIELDHDGKLLVTMCQEDDTYQPIYAAVDIGWPGSDQKARSYGIIIENPVYDDVLNLLSGAIQLERPDEIHGDTIEITVRSIADDELHLFDSTPVDGWSDSMRFSMTESFDLPHIFSRSDEPGVWEVENIPQEVVETGLVTTQAIVVPEQPVQESGEDLIENQHPGDGDDEGPQEEPEEVPPDQFLNNALWELIQIGGEDKASYDELFSRIYPMLESNLKKFTQADGTLREVTKEAQENAMAKTLVDVYQKWSHMGHFLNNYVRKMYRNNVIGDFRSKSSEKRKINNKANEEGLTEHDQGDSDFAINQKLFSQKLENWLPHLNEKEQNYLEAVDYLGQTTRKNIAEYLEVSEEAIRKLERDLHRKCRVIDAKEWLKTEQAISTTEEEFIYRREIQKITYNQMKQDKIYKTKELESMKARVLPKLETAIALQCLQAKTVLSDDESQALMKGWISSQPDELGKEFSDVHLLDSGIRVHAQCLLQADKFKRRDAVTTAIAKDQRELILSPCPSLEDYWFEIQRLSHLTDAEAEQLDKPSSELRKLWLNTASRVPSELLRESTGRV